MSTDVDRPTLAAIAVVAFALANVVHEGVGHGGACLLAGGRAPALSATHFDSDLAGLDPEERDVALALAAGRHFLDLLAGTVDG